MKQVFVSYSRHNLDAVTQLIRDLNAVGVNTWHDQTLTGGQRWWDNILANIRDCDIFIFALSPESWESEACKSELDYVCKLGKQILPVLVSDGININLLHPPLSEIQITDCRSGEKESVLALVKSIYSTPASPPLPDPLPPLPRVPMSYLSNLNDRIETTETMDPEDQKTLLFDLEEELRKGRSPKEVRALLLRFRGRDDLLARIGTKIDAALKSLDENPTAQPPKPAAPNPAQHPRQDRAPVAQIPPVVQPEVGDVPIVPGSKSFRYTCPSGDNPRLVADVERWLQSQGFDTQQMRTDNQSLLLQIKKRGKWRDYLGMATSLNIAFHQSGDALTVQIGAGNWVDKAAAGTVGMFVLWPLAISAGYGIWEQQKTPERVFDFISSRLTYKSQ